MPGDYQTLAEETGAPDAGNAAIAARFAAQAGPLGVAGSAQAGAGGQGHGPAKALVSPDDVWPGVLPVGFLNAAGTIDPVDWGPPTGWAWRITEVPVIFGAGCTLVQFYTESALSGRGVLFQTTASGLWEPSRLYLIFGERLVAVATGGGVTIAPRTERIAAHFLPTYLA